MNLSIVLPGLIWLDKGDINYLYPKLKTPNLNSLIKHSYLSNLNHSYSDIILSTYYANDPNVKNNDKIAEQIAKINNLSHFKYYLIAEPTHLRVDRDRLLISEPGLLQLKREEMFIIRNTINSHFKDELKLYNITDELWLLGTNIDISKINFYPTLDIIGENIDGYLAQGENSIQLNKMLNEIQMLLFKLDFNKKRKSEGLLSVNSLWLWNKDIKKELLKEFGKNTNISSIKMPDKDKKDFLYSGLEDGSFNNKLLIINHLHASCCYRDHRAWINNVEDFDNNLGSILNSFFKKNKIKKLNIFLPLTDKTLKLQLNSIDKFKFWKNINLLKIVKGYGA